MSKYATMVRTRGWLERETRVARERGKIRRSQWWIDEVQGPGTRTDAEFAVFVTADLR